MSQTYFPEPLLPFPRGCPILGANPAGAIWHILAMLAQWEQCQLPRHPLYPWLMEIEIWGLWLQLGLWVWSRMPWQGGSSLEVK